MLKKIQVRDLVMGMYIHEVCCSWMDNPFWHNAFLLTNKKDLSTFFDHRIKEVWIDTRKGVDTCNKTKIVLLEEENRQIDSTLAKIADQQPTFVQKVSLSEELVKAQQILSNITKDAVIAFEGTRKGHPVNIEQLAGMVDQLKGSILRNPDAILGLVRQKSATNYDYIHLVGVSSLMMALGRQLDYDNETIKELGMAGFLLDIGKSLLPNQIVHKTGKLTLEEFNLLKTHTQKGWEFLKLSKGISDIALDVCLHHHECIDGTGYPDQLAGDKIGTYARMASICDVYDAISSNRCYNSSWEPAESLRKMTEWKKGKFDDDIFGAFVKTIGIYPSGTLVKLKSGRLAVVVEQTETSLLKPIVKAFFSTSTKVHVFPELIDLSRSSDTIIAKEDPKSWGFDLMKIAYA